MAAIPANHLQPQTWDWMEEPADSCWSLQAGSPCQSCQTPSALWVCSWSLFLLLLTPPCQRDVLSAPFQAPPGQDSWHKLPGRPVPLLTGAGRVPGVEPKPGVGRTAVLAASASLEGFQL